MSAATVDSSKRHQRVGLLIELHRWREALAELGPILAEDPGNYNALCQKALCHFYLREAQAAYDTTKTAIENGPEYEWAYRIQSHIFAANGETKRALDAARICVEKAPHFVEAQQTLFFAQMNYGLISDARSTLQMLTTLAPDSASTHSAKGHYGIKIQDFSLAESAFLEALKLEPDDATVLNDLGAVYHEKFKRGFGKQYKQMSLEMFERAVRAQPTLTLAQNNIGLVKTKPTSGAWKAGFLAIFVFLVYSPLEGILHAAFAGREPLRLAVKEMFSPSRGDDFIVIVNSAFFFILSICMYVGVGYLIMQNKSRFREKYSTPAFWKAFLCLNLGMIVIYCVALYQSASSANWFPGVAIRFLALGAFVAIVRLINIRQSESAESMSQRPDGVEDDDGREEGDPETNAEDHFAEF